MPSVHRQENNIVHAIRGCAKSAAPDVLYAARIDVYAQKGLLQNLRFAAAPLVTARFPPSW